MERTLLRVPLGPISIAASTDDDSGIDSALPLFAFLPLSLRGIWIGRGVAQAVPLGLRRQRQLMYGALSRSEDTIIKRSSPGKWVH